MKKIILFITLMAQSMLIGGCSDETDYFEGFDEFLEEVSLHAGTRVMHVSDVHCHFKQLEGMLKVAEKCAELVVNTGDDAEGLPGCSFSNIEHDFLTYRSVVDGCLLPVLGVQGNHDAFCTSKEYREAMVDKMKFLTPGSTTGEYGYYDYEDLRFILLDPRDTSDAADEMLDWWTAVFSQRQIDWLIATLDDARQRDLGVVTVMHYGFGDNKNFDHGNLRPDIDYSQSPFMIPDIIDAMQTGEELKMTYNTKGAGDEKIEVDIPASDYKLEFVAHLYGHLHCRDTFRCAKFDGSRNYNILMLGETSLSKKGGTLDTIKRKDEDDIAASLLVIDRSSRQIHRISYGAYIGERCTTLSY